MQNTLRILLPRPFDHGFDYLIPTGMQLAPGDVVEVPFGNQKLFGIVWGQGKDDLPTAKLKTIARKLDHIPPMSTAMCEFIKWMSWYTLTPIGAILKMALASPDALDPNIPKKRRKQAAPALPVLRSLGEGGSSSHRVGQQTEAEDNKTETRSADRVSLELRPMASSAERAGGNQKGAEQQANAGDNQSINPNAPTLSETQTAAAETLRQKLQAGFSVTLLDGVTGSGKTEVYFDAIASLLDNTMIKLWDDEKPDRHLPKSPHHHTITSSHHPTSQILILLPEIALSIQWLARFEERFGFTPAVWHSDVTRAQKRETWRGIARGEIPVVVGARSALFLPFKNLALIIIDEEHEAAYKQEEGVLYHARDMAIARANKENIPTLLVSATPSLETRHNVEQGKYSLIHLPNRHGGASLPDIHTIDMREEKLPASQWLSAKLKSEMLATLKRGEQIMLFLNRRGYAPLLLCRTCGHRFQCPQCASWLVLHGKSHKLSCHHCGYVAPIPKACPDCAAEESLAACGPGVERVEEEVREILPDARIAVMTSDTTESPKATETIVGDVQNGTIDILIGTQMIAKGHHFKNMTLVGVIDADLGLAGGDLRAGERTYQLLHQVAGRAGREQKPGSVYLQTYAPTHPVMQTLIVGDRDAFMQLEKENRESAQMPPYGKLAALIIEGRVAKDVEHTAHTLARNFPQNKGATLMGPTPAPLALLRGRHRWRLLIHTPLKFNLQGLLESWLATISPPTSVRIKTDIDPYSFM